MLHISPKEASLTFADKKHLFSLLGNKSFQDEISRWKHRVFIPRLLYLIFILFCFCLEYFFPEWKYLDCQYKQNRSSLYKKSKNTKVP